MLSLIKKDLLIIFASKWKVAIFMIFVPLIIYIMGIESEFEVYTISIVSVYFLTTTLGTFIVPESSILLQSLPLNKNEVVLSKYISLFINWIMVNVYIMAIILIFIKLMPNSNVHQLNIELFKFSLLLNIISTSLALPGILSYSQKTGNIICNIVFILALYISNISLFIHNTNNKAYVKNLNIVNNPWINIGAGILLIISILISINGYKKREFY